MQVGRWQVETLEFGRFRLDGGAMFGVVPRNLWEKKAPPDEQNRIALAMRCLLLRDGERTVLVDCGVGDKESARFHEIFALENAGSDVRTELGRRGLAVEDISDLVLTHLHFDHVGGAVTRQADGRLVPTFPNARIHVQRRQWEWALSPSPRDRASYLKDNLDPLRELPLVLGDGPGELLPGLGVRIVEGHTPGMQLLQLEGDGDQPGLIYCADLVPTAAHLPPAWVMGYDLQPLKALAEKQALYRDADEGRYWLVFEHDPRHAAARVRLVHDNVELMEQLECL